jgi:putative ABC transport system permease protein
MAKFGLSPRLIGEKILRAILPSSECEALLGDFEEIYKDLSLKKGRSKALFWYWKQIIKLLPSHLFDTLCWRTEMIKNWLKVTLRNSRRHKLYAFINVFGLSVGMACFLLIFMHISDELSYDRYHQNAELIFRVTYEINHSDSTTYTAQTPAPLGPAMSREYPEVKNAVRIFSRQDIVVAYKNKKFYENFIFSDESLFDIFTFPLLKGDPSAALREPNSIVITEEMAKKYFGREDPLNKTLTVNQNMDLKVTAVLQDIPPNSHFHFDFLVPFVTLFQNNKRGMEFWGNIFYYNYILLDKGASPADLEKKFPSFAMKYIGGNFKDFFKDKLDQVPSMYIFHLQPLTKIHLYSHLEDEFETNGNAAYVVIFSAIAFFILFIACINFMNLSTARSTLRAKEVGMRKVVGARRGELIKQFLGESLFLSFFSLILAMVLVKFALPFFNSLSGKELLFSSFAHWPFLAAILGTFVIVGLLA